MTGIEDTSSSRDREEGLTKRLATLGTQISHREVGQYSYQGGLHAARAMLARPERPDTVFCANDVMAIAMMDVATGEFGLRVPEDLSVAGYDNIAPAVWPGYGLTSVDQNIEAMVEQAVAILLERLQSPGLAPERRFIIPELCVRRSTTPTG